MLAHDLRRAAAAAFDRLHEAERATATARDAVRVRGQTAELHDQLHAAQVAEQRAGLAAAEALMRVDDHDRLLALLDAAQSGRAVAVR
jgi:hypothetical protein